MIGFKKLVNEDKVVALYSGAVNSQAEALFPLMAKTGPLVIGSPGAVEPSRRLLLFCREHDQAMSQEAAFRWLQKKGFRKIGVLTSTDTTGQEATKFITEIAAKFKMPIVMEHFDIRALDVTPQLVKIRSARPNALIGWASGSQAALIVKTAKQHGMNIPFFTSWSNQSRNFLKLLAGIKPVKHYIEGLKSVAWRDLPATDPMRKIGKKYYDLYEAKYKESDVV